jgi:hypothetical protein
MKKVLTKQLVAEVNRLREHLTMDEVSAKLGISIGSVANATKMGKSKGSKPKATPVAAVETEQEQSVPTMDELRGWLGQLVRDASEEAKRQKAAGDSGAFNAASRNLTAASLLLSRLTPPEKTEDKEGVYVTNEEMQKHGDAAMAKLSEAADRFLREEAHLPRCRTCEQPMGAR